MFTKMKSASSAGKRFMCMAITLIMLIGMMLPLGINVAANEEITTMTFKNVSGDGGADKISMVNERTFEVTVPISENTDSQALIDEGLIWTLSREKGIQDENEYPYQYLGGKLTDWTKYNSSTPLFTIQSTNSVTNDDGSKSIVMTFSNTLLFGNSKTVSSARNNILDYTGEYDLTCAAADGTVLGTVAVRVNPYDSFRTVSEFAEELVLAADYANSREDINIYAEVQSLGQSTNGLDMPYIIIADSKATLDNWQALLERAQSNPEQVLAEIEAGTLEYKVPILYSNVHADENDGADAPMNFVWDLVASDETNNKLVYETLTEMTEAGQEKIELQRKTRGQHTSSLISDWTTFLGAITPSDTSSSSGVVDLDSYYVKETKSLDVTELLEDVFFIIVPEENVDGRAHNTRTAGGGVDLNRDNLFQTQAETKNMTAMIADWNPVAFMEFHGFVSGFQVEPCSPPHEPNIEYDLFAEMGVKGGEAFGAAAVSNNDYYNSYVMPLRDYLTTNSEGNAEWEEPWDDMSTNYTPQYSLLHGTVAYTVEIPGSNEEGTKALEYGMMGHSSQVAENKETYLKNVVEVYKRGVNNEDVEKVRDWYVDVYDNVGAEAEIYRPRTGDNNNYFPEYYVIPMDVENQSNIAAAYDMEEQFIRNNIKVSKLTEDTEYNGVIYKAGSVVIDMHQAKRNVANAMLYDGVLITGWSDLYSEPITAFGKTRGFECDAIHTAGVFEGKLVEITEAEQGSTVYIGEEGEAVVISNSGMQAVNAINALLDAGKQVGYITEGQYKGDFAVSYADFNSIKDEFIVTAYGVKKSPICREISKPTLYIVGKAAQANVGYVDYNEKRDNTYNFNRIAFAEQMGFTVTTDINEADVIVANKTTQSYERNAVSNAVAAGKPIVIMGTSAFNGIVSSDIRNLFTYYTRNSSFDWLTTVEYIGESMVTDSYRADNDNIMYGFGGNYFTSVPEEANILIRTTNDMPMEGFFQASALEGFLGQIVAFEYITDSVDLTVFANSLTNKMHQQDDYGYASNAIYSKVLGDEIEIPVDIKGNYIIESPESSNVGEIFKVTFKLSDSSKGIKLVNEKGSKVSLTSVSSNENIWTISTKVGTSGQGRTFSIYSMNAAGQYVDTGLKFTLDIGINTSAAADNVTVDYAEFDKASVMRNEAVSITIGTSSNADRITISNENGGNMGKTLIVKAAMVDGLEWVYDIKIGTPGDRTFSVKAANQYGNYNIDSVQTASITVI